MLGRILKEGLGLQDGGIRYLVLLDELEIYGTGIYILFKDKCQGDVKRLLLLLRGVQLGCYSRSKLKELAGDQYHQVHVSDEIWSELDLVSKSLKSG